MSFPEPRSRRRERADRRQLRGRPERLAALGSLGAVVTIVFVLIVTSIGGSGPGATGAFSTGRPPHSATSATTSTGNGQSAATAVPILVYHVINAVPAQSGADPTLYVPADEFSSQMDALKANGWHAVTLDQMEANWTRGTPLGPGKPIVLSFDNGYASHYTNALPVLKRLGWPAVENLQLTGRPPSDGGLTGPQIHGLVAAGWELDTQGVSHADLISLDPARLGDEIGTARQTLRSQYNVPVDWFSYPSGHYNAAVVAAVRAAGFVGGTTVVPGWASAQDDRFRLPRLPVAGGTTPAKLLAQIAAANTNAPVPPAYSGPGIA
jgi:peptidoglycan/xylan/chitin deacetylase (PgdA/CDA1 family)